MNGDVPVATLETNLDAVIIPEALILVALAAPNVGVTNVGLVANTRAPEPVSPVTAEARFDDDGVAKKVATLAPNPEIPVETGSPVAS